MMTQFLICLLFPLVLAIDTDNWDFVFKDVEYLTISNSTVWRLQAMTPDSNGLSVDQWDNIKQTWILTSSRCMMLSLSDPYLYCANIKSILYFTENTKALQGGWTPVGPGYEFKSSTTGQVWYLSATNAVNGYTVYKFDTPTKTSTLVPSNGAVKIGPSPDGNAWIVTSSGTIQKYDGTSWITLSGVASDIIVESDGIPVILTKAPSPYGGGYTVQRWSSNTSTWADLAGIGGIALTVDGLNTPYIVTSSYEVYRLRGSLSNICPSKF